MKPRSKPAAPPAFLPASIEVDYQHGYVLDSTEPKLIRHGITAMTIRIEPRLPGPFVSHCELFRTIAAWLTAAASEAQIAGGAA